MDNNIDVYTQITFQALDILKIPYNRDADWQHLLIKLRYALPFAANSTEREIQLLCGELATKIESKDKIAEIKHLLEKLDKEVSFLPFE